MDLPVSLHFRSFRDSSIILFWKQPVKTPLQSVPYDFWSYGSILRYWDQCKKNQSIYWFVKTSWRHTGLPRHFQSPSLNGGISHLSLGKCLFCKWPSFFALLQKKGPRFWPYRGKRPRYWPHRGNRPLCCVHREKLPRLIGAPVKTSICLFSHHRATCITLLR